MIIAEGHCQWWSLSNVYVQIDVPYRWFMSKPIGDGACWLLMVIADAHFQWWWSLSMVQIDVPYTHGHYGWFMSKAIGAGACWLSMSMVTVNGGHRSWSKSMFHTDGNNWCFMSKTIEDVACWLLMIIIDGHRQWWSLCMGQNDAPYRWLLSMVQVKGHWRWCMLIVDGHCRWSLSMVVTVHDPDRCSIPVVTI